MRLSTKLILFFSGIGIVCLSVAMYVGHTTTVDILDSQIRTALEDYTFHTMDKIDRMLYERYIDVQNIARDPIITSRHSTAGQITERLRSYQGNYGSYASISFFTLDRVSVADTSGKDIGGQHPLTGYWTQLKEDTDVLVDVSHSISLNENVIRFVAYVKDKDGVSFGVIVLRLTLEILYDIVKEVKGSHDTEVKREVDLVNSDGLLIYSNYNSKGLLRDTSSDWVFAKPLLSSGKRIGSTRHRHSEGTEEEILAFSRERGYRDFKGNNWTLIMSIPSRVAFAPVDQLRNRMAIVSVLFAILGLALIYIFSRHITRPLEVLSHGFNEIGKGNLDIRIDVRSRDEIGQMSESFNKMVVELQDYNEKLLTYSIEMQSNNAELKSKARLLEMRELESGLFSRMSELFQACNSVEEASVVITNTLSQLFPHDRGALYIYNSSKNLLESISVWGSPLPQELVITQNECWGLRRGHVHVMVDDAKDLVCQHVREKGVPYICTPIMAKGETTGMLHLMLDSLRGKSYEQDRLKEKEQLALRLAEGCGLAITNLKLQESLRNMSMRDPLTGLFNRRYMKESLELEWQRSMRKYTHIGIIMIDIDHFKQFNDTFGHDGGDKLLCELGMFLVKQVRGGDIACRYGGEEFTIIMPEASVEITTQRAEQIREAASHMHVMYKQQSLGVITLSMGVAVLPVHGADTNTVIQAADTALYRAKNEGRNRVCVAEEVNGQSVFSEVI
ncbi:MAG: diguanylate cyclase [Nitrospirae bacterium]|nr:diguanylate cyclase [Nitrospirota bacterium]MBF0590645.1 diguanylate cyclase [Nitrospirota bacterium]